MGDNTSILTDSNGKSVFIYSVVRTADDQFLRVLGSAFNVIIPALLVRTITAGSGISINGTPVSPIINTTVGIFRIDLSQTDTIPVGVYTPVYGSWVVGNPTFSMSYSAGIITCTSIMSWRRIDFTFTLECPAPTTVDANARIDIRNVVTDIGGSSATLSQIGHRTSVSTTSSTSLNCTLTYKAQLTGAFTVDVTGFTVNLVNSVPLTGTLWISVHIF